MSPSRGAVGEVAPAETGGLSRSDTMSLFNVPSGGLWTMHRSCVASSRLMRASSSVWRERVFSIEMQLGGRLRTQLFRSPREDGSRISPS